MNPALRDVRHWNRGCKRVVDLAPLVTCKSCMRAIRKAYKRGELIPFFELKKPLPGASRRKKGAKK